MGLGWHITARDGHELVFQDGETGGFSSFMAYDRQRQVAVVVSSDIAIPEGVGDLGLFLLSGGGPLYLGTTP